MIKKSRNPVKKKTISTKTDRKTRDIEKVLIDNSVSLQKVMTNLSLKFDSLASQISKLLELFEISAKNLAQKDFSLEKENKDNKEITSKLDNLINQNKIIARGLTLMHESNPPKFKSQPSRNLTEPKLMDQKLPAEVNEYQKSISSDKKDALPKPKFQA